MAFGSVAWDGGDAKSRPEAAWCVGDRTRQASFSLIRADLPLR